MLLWCSSFPTASFLPRSQRQAGHTYSLTPAGVKTLKNRKKIFIRGFHRVSSGFPALLQRGNVHQAKDMRRSLKLSKIPVKIFCPVETYARAGHSSGPLYTHFLTCFSQGSVPTAPETQHKPYSPTQTQLEELLLPLQTWVPATGTSVLIWTPLSPKQGGQFIL